MKGFCGRFAPLMAETLHFAGDPSGLQVPLKDVNARLVELADQERAAPAPAAVLQELNLARFAAAAWADEQILGSPRPDAALWAGMSLQYRYFSTSEAGAQFYRELEKCLDAAGAPSRVRLSGADAGGGLPPDETPLPAFGEERRVDEGHWRELDLAERIAAAAELPGDAPGRAALEVFAYCLLCGFRGSLYGDGALLSQIRKSCRALFARVPEAQLPPPPKKAKRFLAGLERASWVLVPLLVCALFALYCGGILANAPLGGRF